MKANASPIDLIINACRAGHQTLLISGRSLSDLHSNERDEIRPLQHSLIRRVKEEFGMATLLFNLALGARWNWEGFSDEERKSFEQKMQAAQIPLQHGITASSDHRSPPYERAFLLLAALQRSIEQGVEIPPIMICLAFGEDLAPDNDRGSSSDWVIQISEMIQLLAEDYQRRRHPFLVILSGTPDRMDRRVVNCLYPLSLVQPDREEKLRFIEALRKAPHLQSVQLENGLDDQTVANLTARTPNRSLEESFLESSRTNSPITHGQLIERKRTDVVSLSEGTLILLDIERVRRIKLVGRTVEKVLALLAGWAAGLKAGNPHTPMNILLAGAPSSAKTDIALLTALTAQVPAYQVISPKGSLVGQTERLVRLLFRVFKELSPAFGVMDEVTEAFQMERNSMNLDSGSSAAIVGEMLNALSDSSRAGKTLLIATTNCPWKIGSAMASRFLFVPVLSAVEDDYPSILCSVAASLIPEVEWDASDAAVLDAARTFYQKGATPRLMRSLLSSKIACDEDRTSTGLLLRAAKACASQDPRDRASSEYADLFAIRVCSDLEMLPWHGCVSEYPFPSYLREIVSNQDGSIDWDRLNRRIEELEPHVNV
jgi:ATPase family protein associated with various cellular activities (AAA)